MTRLAYVCADPGIPVFGTKGAAVHVREVVRALRRRGVHVELFATRTGGPPPPDLADVAVHPLPVPAGALADREAGARAANGPLVDALSAAGPFDIVYERYALWSWAGMAWARAGGAAGILEVNAPLVDEQAHHRGLSDRAAAEAVATRVLGDAAAVVAVSTG
ncbi:MAG: glycosyltransferase family 4 protein, partial [Egibacteraceae bacterium]